MLAIDLSLVHSLKRRVPVLHGVHRHRCHGGGHLRSIVELDRHSVDRAEAAEDFPKVVLVHIYRQVPNPQNSAVWKRLLRRFRLLSPWAAAPALILSISFHRHGTA